MSSFPRLALIVTALVALLVGVFATLSISAADAQSPEPARMTVEGSAEADRTFANIALDVGTTDMAAVGGSLVFDDSLVQAVSCELSTAGACNVVDGQVLFAGFEANGFDDTDALLTVEFTPLVPQAASGVDLELRVDTAVVESGARLGDLQVVSGELEFVESEGAVTGDVTANGEGLFGLEVCLAADAGPSCTTTSGLGSFVIEGLPSGTYDLVVTDPNGMYASATRTVDIESPNMTTGADFALSPADAPVVEEPVEDDPAADDAADSGEPAAQSIAGTVTDAATDGPIFGVQVCATMPLVLTQSCAFTDVDGRYEIADLVDANYGVTASDPAQRYVDSADETFVSVSAEHGSIVDLSLDRN